jgi:hypothetical protein
MKRSREDTPDESKLIMPKTPRLDTRLESEAAEFLVLGNLLLERIPTYKTYTNMPGYDLVATNPERNTSAKIQVKSRWRTNAPGFPIKNFGCDFVVFCRLNRGSKKGTATVRAPEFYVFPVVAVRDAWNADDPCGKVAVSRIPEWESFLNRWDLIRDFLADGEPLASPVAPRNRDSTRISIAEFRRLAGVLDGKRLETGRRGRGFTVQVYDGGLEFTPESSGVARRQSWQRIERVLDRYNDVQSFNPGDYQDITHHSSYLIAILRHLLPEVHGR